MGESLIWNLACDGAGNAPGWNKRVSSADQQGMYDSLGLAGPGDTMTPALLWRHLATLTSGLEAGDCRLPLVSASLNACDEAFAGGDPSGFRRAAVKVEQAMQR
ncbi:MAG: hypothetical protein ABIU05_01745 [Nitrospirales bacterium]